MDAQKPDNGARLSRDPGQNFFRSVNYLTLLDRFLIDAARGSAAQGAHLVNAA
jgi:hypothetical protein